jgi:pimeloyl-ACP methyl ester carboxylesterase
MIELHHGELKVCLHALRREGEAEPLLLLHALGGSAADWDVGRLAWPGPVYALDFSGHGHSDSVRGGAYHPEYWACDADIALAAIGGRASLVGAGVGAYVALLLAGARAQEITRALLLAGAGLDGGGAMPDFERPFQPPQHPRGPRLSTPSTDPAVDFSQFGVRTPKYASGFARAARRIVLLEDGWPRPPWWHALRELTPVRLERGELAGALERATATAD